MRTSFIAGLAAVGLMTTGANAATFTVFDSISDSDSVTGISGSGGVATINLIGFDTLAGTRTLNSVDLQFSGLWSGTYEVTIAPSNLPSNGGTGEGTASGGNDFASFEFGSEITWYLANQTGLGATTPALPISGATDIIDSDGIGFNVSLDITDGDPSNDSYSQAVDGSYDTGVLSANNTSVYEDVPGVQFVFEGNIDDDTGGGGTLRGVTGTYSVNANITYNYSYEVEREVIPVPAALPLMASALGVFGVMRYRKRK